MKEKTNAVKKPSTAEWKKKIGRLYNTDDRILEHVFRLREGEEAREDIWAYFELPRDITTKEADALAKFIKGLVIKK